jgi:hypothetical protein
MSKEELGSERRPFLDVLVLGEIEDVTPRHFLYAGPLFLGPTFPRSTTVSCSTSKYFATSGSNLSITRRGYFTEYKMKQDTACVMCADAATLMSNSVIGCFRSLTGVS